MDPKLIGEALDALEAGDSAKALEILKSLIASAAGGEATPAEAPPDAAVSESADAPPADEEDEDKEKLGLLHGKKCKPKKRTDGEADQTTAAPDAVTWTAADAEELKTLRAERVERDLNERRELIAGLVQLDAETPATAWEGDAAKRNPVKRLADEPLADLRARVKALQRRPNVVTRRADTSSDELTEGEQRQLAGLKTQEQKDRFIALRAQRRKGLAAG